MRANTFSCIYYLRTTTDSFPDDEAPIETLHDVLERGKRIIVTPGGTVEMYLKTSHDPVSRALYRNRFSVPVSQNDENLFRHLDNGLVSTVNAHVF
jgi:hypothetical protein